MSLKKIISVLGVVGMLSGLLTACVGNGGNTKPTPGAGVTKEPDEEDTTATEIILLDGESERQSSFLKTEGGRLSFETIAHQGSSSFRLSGREMEEQGVSLEFLTINGAVVDVIGKRVHISFWVYHLTRKEETFSCRLQIKAKDGTLHTPVNFEAAVPSGVWTLVETDLDVPGDIKTATVKLTMSSSKGSFYLDDVCLSYDPASKVADFTVPAPSVPTKEPVDTSKLTLIHNITADQGADEQKLFQTSGTASVVKTGNGRSGSAYRISGSTDGANGVGLNFQTLAGKGYEVSGKEVYVSFWAYHEGEEPLEVYASVYAVKPNGEEARTNRLVLSRLEGGTWTFIEGFLPVAANVTSPRLVFEVVNAPEAEVLLDDICVMVKQNSSVAADQGYDDEVLKELKTVTIDFEDDFMPFEKMGRGEVNVVKGGHESPKALRVNGRLSASDGARLELSKYDIAGKTLTVSFWVYNGQRVPIQFLLHAQQRNEDTIDEAIVVDEAVKDGKWVKCTGTFTVKPDTTRVLLIFNSTDAYADFYLDDVVIEAAP